MRWILCISLIIAESVKVDSEGDHYDENGIISERYIGNIVSVFIPDWATLHLHTLAIILSDSHLHDILVAFVFAKCHEGLLRVQAQLSRQGVLPVLLVCLALLLLSTAFLVFAWLSGVFLFWLFLVLCRLLRSVIALLVLSDQIWDHLLDGSSGLSRSELRFEGRSNLILRLGFCCILL